MRGRGARGRNRALQCVLGESALSGWAALVWQLIDGKRSIAEMELLLTDAYPEAVTLKGDLSEAIEVLSKHGVIHL